MAETLRERCAQHEGLSGIVPLEDGMEAFVTRMALAGAAVSSIDVQYYIWRADMTGHLLLKALLRAADRGVRVRLLLDDNGIDGLDDVLASLQTHPNIEIRLFNLFVLRRFKRLSYAFGFFRLNHRIHNKAFTVDGCASILGGRNVGDEYFGTGVNPLQIDLDVLAVGELISLHRPETAPPLVDLFLRLRPNAIIELAKKGKTIVREDDFADHSMLLIDGRVAHSKMLSGGDTQIIDIMLPGDFALVGAVHAPVATCSIDALSDARYTNIRPADANGPEVELADLRQLIAAEIVRTQSRTSELLLRLGKSSSASRIA